MAPIPANRPNLTPDLCQQIVVNVTPEPAKFKDRSQDLFDLGVVDGTQKQIHHGRIQSALSRIGYQIAQSDISSGPGVIVGDCADSVRVPWVPCAFPSIEAIAVTVKGSCPAAAAR